MLRNRGEIDVIIARIVAILNINKSVRKFLDIWNDGIFGRSRVEW